MDLDHWVRSEPVNVLVDPEDCFCGRGENESLPETVIVSHSNVYGKCLKMQPFCAEFGLV